MPIYFCYSLDLNPLSAESQNLAYIKPSMNSWVNLINTQMGEGGQGKEHSIRKKVVEFLSLKWLSCGMLYMIRTAATLTPNARAPRKLNPPYRGPYKEISLDLGGNSSQTGLLLLLQASSLCPTAWTREFGFPDKPLGMSLQGHGEGWDEKKRQSQEDRDS